MGNSLRCCLACVLPCGALDLIRVVHLSGYVEEITGPVTAGEILKANPNHILSKPCSQGMARKILILSPDSELKRGGIYFLIPASSLPEKKRSNEGSQKRKPSKKGSRSSGGTDINISYNSNNGADHHQDKYLAEDCKSSRRRSSRRDRRSGGGSGVWQPRLESIVED